MVDLKTEGGTLKINFWLRPDRKGGEMRDSILKLVKRRAFLIWLIVYFLVIVLVSWLRIWWLWLFDIPAFLLWVGWLFLMNWIWICPNCQEESFIDSFSLFGGPKYCVKCGSPLELARRIKRMKICPNGHKIEDKWDLYQRCPKCGGQLIESGISPHLIRETARQRQKEEKERGEIEKLISETEKLIDEIIPGMKNPEIRAALIIIKGGELPQILQQFDDEKISYLEAKERILRLQEDAKILGLAPAEEETYYHILGVSENASQAEIRQSYLEKIKEYHPDSQPPGSKQWVRERADEMTKKLNEAFNILGDPKKRREYDKKIGIRR